MKIIITPTYKDLFEGETPKLEYLIKDIPSKAVLSFLCIINAKLFISEEKKTQYEIFQIITRRLPEDQIKQILRNAIKLQLKDPAQEVQFFSYLGSLEFIHYELLNYKDFSLDDTTPDQEFRLLKAYFVIVEKINKNYELVFGKSFDKGEFFQTATWPTFIEQIEINHRPNPVNALIRSLIFFNYFDENLEFKKYLEKFVNFHDKKNYWEYSKFLMNILQINWQGKKTENRFGNFALQSTKEVNTLLNNFSLDINAYKRDYKVNKKNYSGLKESPLIEIDPEYYLVINWNFITNKVYEGLIFDFYNHSGFKDDKRFKTFLDYKNFIAQEITEKHLFRKILSHYFKSKYSTLKFDYNDCQGFPDAYYRSGKYVFLFEIKDAYFPSKAINSYDYEEICEAIDLKYNSKSKGTGQIIKQLNSLTKKPYEDKTYQELNIKSRNLVIYPVIIYTDNFFSMPGINRYINNSFKQKLKNENLDNHFQKINNLLFMNVSFLINQIHNIDDFDFRNCFDNYFQKLKNSEKKFNKNHHEKDMQEMNMTFENFISENYITKKKNPDYINKIFEIFGIRKHFA